MVRAVAFARGLLPTFPNLREVLPVVLGLRVMVRAVAFAHRRVHLGEQLIAFPGIPDAVTLEHGGQAAGANAAVAHTLGLNGARLGRLRPMFDAITLKTGLTGLALGGLDLERAVHSVALPARVANALLIGIGPRVVIHTIALPARVANALPHLFRLHGALDPVALKARRAALLGDLGRERLVGHVPGERVASRVGQGRACCHGVLGAIEPFARGACLVLEPIELERVVGAVLGHHALPHGAPAMRAVRLLELLGHAKLVEQGLELHEILVSDAETAKRALLVQTAGIGGEGRVKRGAIVMAANEGDLVRRAIDARELVAQRAGVVADIDACRREHLVASETPQDEVGGRAFLQERQRHGHLPFHECR